MEWECKYCKAKLTLKNKFTKSGHLARCKTWKLWVEKYLTRNFFEQKYISEEKSLLEIAEELELDSVSTLYKKLKEFNIPIRSISSSWKISNKKRVKTNIERYGADCILYKNHPKRLEFEAKLLEEHGVLNVFQLESVKEKIKQFYLDGYGVTSATLVPEIKQKQIETLKKNHVVDNPLQLAKKNKRSNCYKTTQTNC